MRVTFTKIEPFAAGVSLGQSGAYERVVGVICGSLDPLDVRNDYIANLQKATRNAAGLVEYESDLFMLRPTDPKKRNGKVFYDVTNRGGKPVLPWLNEAPETTVSNNNDPRSLSDAGNRFLLEDGWTLLWSGWDATVAFGQATMGIRLPFATNNGNPIVKRIREDFVPGQRNGNTVFPLTYEIADYDQSFARLTIRAREKDEFTEISADRWRYDGPRSVKLLPDGTDFEQSAIYDFWYPAKNPSTLGIGLAAVRDALSWMRFESGERVDSVIGFGVSLSGRFLREFIGLGLNRDIAGRQLFDGVLIYIAGASRTFTNFEFGQPARTRTQHRDHNVPEIWFPFAYAESRDPVSGAEASLLTRDTTGLRIMSVNSSTEYWMKGASIIHTDPEGKTDLVLPNNVRVYLIAGTQHGAIPSQRQGKGECSCIRNPHSPSPVLRALVVALDRWVSNGIVPPASCVPTLADSTLVSVAELCFPYVPGLPGPDSANEIVPTFDWIDPPRHIPSPYRPMVCAVDKDGNEIAGIRTPDIAVPVGTHTGWNYHDTTSTCRELCHQSGAFVPFAHKEQERASSGDTRLSLEERYISKADYVERVRKVVTELVERRLLLEDDGTIYIARAQASEEFRSL